MQDPVEDADTKLEREMRAAVKAREEEEEKKRLQPGAKLTIFFLSSLNISLNS